MAYFYLVYSAPTRPLGTPPNHPTIKAIPGMTEYLMTKRPPDQRKITIEHAKTAIRLGRFQNWERIFEEIFPTFDGTAYSEEDFYLINRHQRGLIALEDVPMMLAKLNTALITGATENRPNGSKPIRLNTITMSAVTDIVNLLTEGEQMATAILNAINEGSEPVPEWKGSVHLEYKRG